MSNAHIDTASNFHPYECDGPGKCVHCDREEEREHDPATCSLCDPGYDHMPNQAWADREGGE